MHNQISEIPEPTGQTDKRAGYPSTYETTDARIGRLLVIGKQMRELVVYFYSG